MNNLNTECISNDLSITTGYTQINTYINTGILPIDNGKDYYPFSHPPIHNVGRFEIVKKQPLTLDTLGYSEDDKKEISAQFPLFFKNSSLIKIPAKVEYVLKNYTSRFLLKEIHTDIDTAIELCLIFLSNLTNTHFLINETDDSYKKLGWKNLKSIYLDEQLGDKNKNLKRRHNIINALSTPTSKGIIMECDKNYMIGHYSYSYRLGPSYLQKGISTYELKTKIACDLILENYYSRFSSMVNNVICKNLLMIYPQYTLPTIAEVNIEADRLIKNKYTKKGKRLVYQGKKSKEHFVGRKVSFVEEAIKKYEFYTNIDTETGFMIPTVGTIKSGKRVYDSFNMIPSWIRKMIKINGKVNLEVDCSCLHPNIAISIYGGKKQYITHQEVAEFFGITDSKEIDSLKTEHLSFFNQRYWQMKKNRIFDYYQKNEPEMLERIIKEKIEKEKIKDYGFTYTRIVAKETEIMTEAIAILNSLGIFAMYIFDGLSGMPEQNENIKQVLNETLIKHGVYTKAK